MSLPIWVSRYGDKLAAVRRVLRGGAFNNNDNNVRCAARNNNSPDNRNNNIGFRVVLSTSAAGNVFWLMAKITRLMAKFIPCRVCM